MSRNTLIESELNIFILFEWMQYGSNGIKKGNCWNELFDEKI